MQTDPIGYADGMNMYAYVGNDPVNFVDSLGLGADDLDEEPERLPDDGSGGNVIVVTGTRIFGPSFANAAPLRLNFAPPSGVLGNVGANGSGGRLAEPQKEEGPSVVDCIVSTGQEHGASLALDVAGVGLSLAPGAKAAVALGGLGLGTATMTNSAVNADPVGFGAGVTTYGFAASGIEASRLSKAAATPLARNIAGSVPVLGTILAVGALAYDGCKAYESYNQCRAGQ